MTATTARKTIATKRSRKAAGKATPTASAEATPKPAKTVVPAGDTITCVGACGETKPVSKFPTITGKPGVRGTTCRACRDAHLPKKAPAAKVTPAT